jgi:hypothetical protein
MTRLLETALGQAAPGACDPRRPPSSGHSSQARPTLPIYSVRIDLDWRAVGVLKGDTMIWSWIGSHDDYEQLLARF